MSFMNHSDERPSFFHVYKAVFGVAGAALVVFSVLVPAIGFKTNYLSEGVITVLGAILGGIVSYRSRLR